MTSANAREAGNEAVIGTAAQTVDGDLFKAAMRVLPSGVFMVTTRVDGRPWGLTVSACCSVSADPPQLLISLGRHTISRERIAEDGGFGVSILHANHKPLAELGARPGDTKFIDGFLEGSGPDDGFSEGAGPLDVHSPVVAGALCHLDCEVAQSVEISTHTIFIGSVRRIVGVERNEPRPLLYFDRRFHDLGTPIVPPASRAE